jgi:hypothetical protein
METVSLSIILLRSNKETAQSTNQTYLNINPEFQRDYEAWNDKLKTRLIESMLLGRAMNPIWVIHNEEDDSQEVLDGMHRLTTGLNYVNNDFALGSDFTTLSTDLYENKRFQDLSSDDKSKIRSYNFSINKLDSSYKSDPEKLQDMYEILNRSSRTLNDYEFHKPLLKPFYDLIGQHTKQFFNSALFDHENSLRGRLDTELIKLLAMCDYCPTDSFSSINDMYMKWQERVIGSTTVAIEAAMVKHSDRLHDALTLAKKVMDKYTQDGLFDNTEKRRNAITIMTVISRTVAIVKSVALFNRHADVLFRVLKDNVVTIDLTGDLLINLDCTSRGAKFQKRLIACVDKLIRETIGGELEEPRVFSKKMIEDKLAEQKRKCPLCTTIITMAQKYEGDHILAWVNGGRTVKENLQVVHHACHKRKTT